MRLPQLDIQSVPIKLNVRTEKGVSTIHQQRGDVQIHSEKATVEIQSHRPVLNIDNTATWDALNGGRPEAFIKRIYSQTTGYVQQHTIAVNQKWRQIADIAHMKENPIPGIAYSDITREPERLPVFGTASRFNTVISFEIQKPDIEITPGKVDIDVETHQQPDIQYKPGKVNISVEQYPKVTVIPPPIVDLLA